jgi:hypothetical protein
VTDSSGGRSPPRERVNYQRDAGVVRETSARSEGVAGACEYKETNGVDAFNLVEARRRRNHRAGGGRNPAERLEADSKK